jgi:4,5-DOPA dioxygenase extradiol
MTQKAPTLFVGHGSPMNAIEDTPSSHGWREIAAAFPKPRAIVCVSAHWITDGVRVTANARPRTIHDFGGFPPELFAVQYPAPSDPQLAQNIVQRLAPFDAALDESWGLDHGTWSVLVHMYPDADIPVVQVSLDARRGPEQHYAIGQALAPLRDDNVLILGSGDIVHNLRAFFQRGSEDRGAEERQFDDDIVEAAIRGEGVRLINYRDHPCASFSAPDWDHFFPLFYVAAARRDGEPTRVFNQHYFPGISMTSIAFGIGA